MGKLKALIALVLVFGGGFIAWKMIPPYFHKYEFQDDLDEIARRNSYTTRTDDDLRAMVVKQASTLDIALKEDQISISRTGDGLGITVHYHVLVDLVVRPVDLDFTVASMNKRI